MRAPVWKRGETLPQDRLGAELAARCCCGLGAVRSHGTLSSSPTHLFLSSPSILGSRSSDRQLEMSLVRWGGGDAPSL